MKSENFPNLSFHYSLVGQGEGHDEHMNTHKTCPEQWIDCDTHDAGLKNGSGASVSITKLSSN